MPTPRLEVSVPCHSIEDPTKLRRILEAVLLIEKDLELPALLRHVIEEAASMTGARYAALGVLNDDKTASRCLMSIPPPRTGEG